MLTTAVVGVAVASEAFSYIAGEIFDFFKGSGKKILDKSRMQKQFIELGSFISGFEQAKQKTVLTELQCIFSKNSMKVLYQDMKDIPGFEWKEQIQSKLEILCVQNGISENEALYFIDSFIQMVFNVLCQVDDIKATHMFLGCFKEDVAKDINGVSQNLADVGHDVKQILNQMIIQNTNESKSILIKTFPVEYAGDIHWDLKHIHVEGLLGDTETRKNELLELTSLWKAERESYPNWFVLPKYNRNLIRIYTQGDVLLQDKNLLPLEKRFDYLYELLWRYEIGLLPYTSYLQNHAYSIWKDVSQEEIIAKDDVKYRWLQIGLFLLREFREDLHMDKWQEIYRLTFDNLEGYDEIAEGVFMENILLNFAEMRITEVISLLNTLEISKYSYSSKLKICSLKAVCGLSEQALNEIENLITEIKDSLSECDAPKLYLYSILACALHLYGFMLQGIHSFEDGIQEKIMACYKERDALEEYYSFRKELGYCADALLKWNEKRDEIPIFELHKETVTIMSTANDCWEAYSFYRILEKTAMPFRLGYVNSIGEVEKSFMKVISEWYPRLSWQLMIRSGNKENIKKCLTRQLLVNYNRNVKDCLFRYTYNALDKNIDGICGIKNIRKYRNIYHYISTVSIVILTRLASVATSGQQLKLITLMVKLIEIDAIHEFRVFDPFICTVMQQANELSKASMLNLLLDCSAKSRIHIEGEEQIDPFDVMGVNKQSLVLYRQSYIDVNLIDHLFEMTEKTSQERVVACARLGQLCEWNKLTSEQKERLGKILWSHLNEQTQLPDLNHYYVFVYLKWPAPERINVAKRIRKYLLDEERLREVINSFNIRSMRDMYYWDQISTLNNEIDEFWNDCHMNTIFSVMNEFWQCGKKQFEQEEHIYEFQKDNFIQTYRHIIRTIASFSTQDISLLSENVRNDLLQSLIEMEKHGIVVCEAKILLAVNEEKVRFEIELINSLYDTDEGLAISASRAMEKCICMESESEHKVELFEELIKVIRARKEPGLISFLISAHNVFYQNKSVFPTKILKIVENAVISIAEQTEYDGNSISDISLKHNIEIRSHCASLAYQLYCYENEFQPGHVHSDATMLWKDICTGRKSGNEFTEVKNRWLM